MNRYHSQSISTVLIMVLLLKQSYVCHASYIGRDGCDSSIHRCAHSLKVCACLSRIDEKPSRTRPLTVKKKALAGKQQKRLAFSPCCLMVRCTTWHANRTRRGPRRFAGRPHRMFEYKLHPRCSISSRREHILESVTSVGTYIGW